MAEAHLDPRFRNAATYQVAITVTIAGGARWQTAHRRAGKVAERLANAATRAADVVEAHAVVGPVGVDGQLIAPTGVRFAAANTGREGYDDAGKLTRYLDPDHERALASLAEARARARARERADRDRRLAVGCRTPSRWSFTNDHPPCECVYCWPSFHLALAREPAGHGGELPRCVCGAPATACRRHVEVALVVLDGDPAELRRLVGMRAAAQEGRR